MSRTRKDAAPKYVTAPRWNQSWPWWKSEPKWWRRLKKHKPRRCERRRAIFTALNGDAEAVTWPLDKKPWAYFW